MTDDIDQIRGIAPTFDLFSLQEVSELAIQFSQDGKMGAMYLDLRLKVAFGMKASQYSVELQFLGVSRLILPEIGPAPLDLSELQVEDVSSRQLEGIRYKVATENSGFQCLCKDVRINTFNAIVGGIEKRVWTRQEGCAS